MNEDVIARYELDRELRRITLGQLERIEVAVRTVMSNQMSMLYGPFWYLNHPVQVQGMRQHKEGKRRHFKSAFF